MIAMSLHILESVLVPFSGGKFKKKKKLKTGVVRFALLRSPNLQQQGEPHGPWTISFEKPPKKFHDIRLTVGHGQPLCDTLKLSGLHPLAFCLTRHV
jgi:hypothetical protein